MYRQISQVSVFTDVVVHSVAALLHVQAVPAEAMDVQMILRRKTLHHGDFAREVVAPVEGGCPLQAGSGISVFYGDPLGDC